jgi:hypothetical protein
MDSFLCKKESKNQFLQLKIYRASIEYWKIGKSARKFN